MNTKTICCCVLLMMSLQVMFSAGAASENVDVRASGAVGDGQTKDTAAFQKALDSCGNAGGGQVLVPAGNYLIGSIQIHANTTLVLQSGAVLIGSPDIDDYPLIKVRYEGAFVPGHRALIFAENADNIAITGPGLLSGDMEIGKLRNPRGPLMVELVNCNHVRLEDFSDRYQRLWSIHLLFCQDVLARGLTIRTHQSNGDGIDIDSSSNVRIENCDIDSGDDCISLKSGRGLAGVKIGRPTEDVVISNCSLGTGFAGVGIGTEMSGGIRNVRIENCKFTHGQNAIYIKSRNGRGGFIDNITGGNFQVTTHTFIAVNLRDPGIIGVDPVPGEDGIPRASHIAFENATVNCNTLVDGAAVLPEKPVDGFSLSNVTGVCRRAISLANFVNVSLNNIKVTGFTEPFLQTRNVTGTGLDGAVALVVPMMLDPDQLRQSLAQPPDDTRPMVRWWWFGPAVTKPEIEREMRMMKQGGFGGFEIQPTYPLAVDGKNPDITNIPFLSLHFFDALNFADLKAKELGMRMDLTLGSGWPYGGAKIPLADAAGRLRTQSVPVPANQSSAAYPNLREGDSVMAAFAFDSMKPLELKDGAALIPADSPGTKEVLFFIAGHTGMKVKRPALGAEGYVVDHQTASAVARFINAIAEPEVSSCLPNIPYALFCDSLESYGEDWTDHFLDEFQKRRGYDLRPLLPCLVDDQLPKALEVRHDWGKTLTELFNDNFVKKMRAFALDKGSLFRVQLYGTPSAGLFSYAYADLPEGEGYQWHDFRETRFAASACHLLGIPVCSSETFTWIHSIPFRATPLDIKAEGDLHFLQGANLIICHGWPYTPPGVGFPGWSFYVGGVFDEQNPWWIVMPDVTRYLQRVSFFLQQGAPANDVALYLSNSDAWANFTPGKVSLSDGVGKCLGNRIVGNLLDAGYNMDFFDDGMLDLRGRVENGELIFGEKKRGEGETRYRVVVLAGVERTPLATLRKLEDFAEHGGLLIATRRLPAIVPGYQASEEDQKTLQTIVKRLFEDPGALGIFVKDESQLADAMSKKARPGLKLSPPTPEIGFVRRHTDGGEIFFLANTGNQPKNVRASLRFESACAEQLDPVTGKITALPIVDHPESYTTVDLKFAPYQSMIIILSNRYTPVSPTTQPTMAPTVVDLNTGWNVQFGADGIRAPLAKLHSWAEDDATKNFSGVATYTNHFTISADAGAPGSHLMLDFGDGAAAAIPAGRTQGFAAAFDAPVRDAAVVYINGKQAGSVWCAPYQLDVTRFVKPGVNDLRVDVANTAVNYLAGHGFPNYDIQAITKQFGTRFQPPAASLFQPIPSGLVGSVRLVTTLQ